MTEKAAELVRLLEAELDLIESGAYEPSAGKPTEDKPMFYHSLVCINHWFVPGHEPECHDDCALLDAVPAKGKAEALPCHHIPLNEAGDTVKSLEEKGQHERVKEEVANWLRNAIRQLKMEGKPVRSDVKY
ncbi:MAG: hypothetical protein KJZ78_25360 [Bryobacteraceae bacterium]|nr:hypothetical protein [Bryobacteraceae bacterium]